MLSNLGAINEEHASTVDLIASSVRSDRNQLAKELDILQAQGYIKRLGDKLYLTESGLVRALSGLS
jgi:hypothetical protein